MINGSKSLGRRAKKDFAGTKENWIMNRQMQMETLDMPKDQGYDKVRYMKICIREHRIQGESCEAQEKNGLMLMKERKTYEKLKNASEEFKWQLNVQNRKK